MFELEIFRTSRIFSNKSGDLIKGTHSSIDHFTLNNFPYYYQNQISKFLDINGLFLEAEYL